VLLVSAFSISINCRSVSQPALVSKIDPHALPLSSPQTDSTHIRPSGVFDCWSDGLELAA